MKVRVLELNASDERGINVVREKVKTFAACSVGASDERYPCPPYKLLILDEADSMTQVAAVAMALHGRPRPMAGAMLRPSMPCVIMPCDHAM